MAAPLHYYDMGSALSPTLLVGEKVVRAAHSPPQKSRYLASCYIAVVNPAGRKSLLRTSWTKALSLNQARLVANSPLSGPPFQWERKGFRSFLHVQHRLFCEAAKGEK
jgi:hypothetical protein